jgi:hypothetical protein
MKVSKSLKEELIMQNSLSEVNYLHFSSSYNDAKFIVIYTGWKPVLLLYSGSNRRWIRWWVNYIHFLCRFLDGYINRPMPHIITFDCIRDRCAYAVVFEVVNCLTAKWMGPSNFLSTWIFSLTFGNALCSRFDGTNRCEQICIILSDLSHPTKRGIGSKITCLAE